MAAVIMAAVIMAAGIMYPSGEGHGWDGTSYCIATLVFFQLGCLRV
jgi:hypothetical protein